MDRVMNGNTIVALLVIGLIISIQGLALAKSEKIEFTRILDLTEPTIIDPGKVWFDKGGNLHVQGMIVEGVSVPTDGKLIKWTSRLEVNSVTDVEGTGSSHGWFIGYLGGELTDETMLWEGNWHGEIVNLISSGKLQGQGRGAFAGMKLEADSKEIDLDTGEPADSSIYLLEGWITNSKGDKLAPRGSNVLSTIWGEIKSR